MKKYLLKLLKFSLIGVIPSTLIIVLYFVLDPFKVIYDYDVLLIDEETKHRPALNKDYVSTTTFIKNSKNTEYNSFIFGNSRSMFYEISDWRKHLPNDAICYHFDASGESIYAIKQKFEYLDKKNVKIKNALVILDYSTLLQFKPQKGRISLITPALIENSNFITYHITNIKAFFNPKFLFVFLDYKLFKTFRPYMKGILVSTKTILNYDPLTNEEKSIKSEERIANGEFYDAEKIAIFYNRDYTNQKYSPKIITEKQDQLLKKIKEITKTHDTNLKVIINPLYDQLKLNPSDLDYLKNLFGNSNVFDFSGINKFTMDYQNYYETSHYRPHVAKAIMDSVYKRP